MVNKIGDIKGSYALLGTNTSYKWHTALGIRMSLIVNNYYYDYYLNDYPFLI